MYEAGTEDTSSSKNLKKESIELWVFYPFNEYSKVESYIKQVENTIKKFESPHECKKRGTLFVSVPLFVTKILQI